MVKLFIHSALKESLGQENSQLLLDDFRDYKDGKGLPITFGRDVPYDFTHNRSVLELQHIHLNLKGFPLYLIQFKRTSGFVLVYCPGFFDPEKYLLIAIIKHFDHARPDEIGNTDRDNNLMAKLELIAERFRNKH